MEVHRSHEYGSTIIHSMTTGKPSVVYGNMPNSGAISNLPAIRHRRSPDAGRPQRPATHHGRRICRRNWSATCSRTSPSTNCSSAPPREGRRDHVYQAAMFDPLTAATLPLDKIVEMCDELIAAHGDLLPKFPAKTLVPTSGKRFPARRYQSIPSKLARRKSSGSEWNRKALLRFSRPARAARRLPQDLSQHGKSRIGRRPPIRQIHRINRNPTAKPRPLQAGQ